MMTPLHRGYTLLEMIVSVGIFSLVMLAATSAYLALISLDREARATTDVVTNLSFVIDSMVREIRIGTDYACNNNQSSPNCPSSPGTSFGFVDSRSPARDVVYSVSGDQVIVTIDGVASTLTDPRVHVDTLAFYVRGVGSSGAEATIQPQVIFVLKGTIEAQPGKFVNFTLQGSATQRLLEFTALDPVPFV